MTPGQRVSVLMWDESIASGTAISGEWVVRYPHVYSKGHGLMRLVSVRLDSGRVLPFAAERVEVMRDEANRVGRLRAEGGR